jgi:acylphosphatase
MSEEGLSRVHALVVGRVQGVGFRYFVLQAANRSEESITGWVRNLADGRVELLAEGPRHALENLLIEVQRGPSASKVNRIERDWGEAQGTFEDFLIRPTALAPPPNS